MKNNSINPSLLFSLEKGQWIGVFPWGYKVTPHQRHGKFNVAGDVYIDEPMAPIITSIFELFSKGGYSLKSLKKHIADEFSVNFHTSTIHRILANKFYIGIMVWKGQEFPHLYPRLTTPEIFNKCQEVLQNNTRFKKHIPIDKTLWDEGPWKNEPDDETFEYKGLKAEIKRHQRLGHLCGYVEIPYAYLRERNLTAFKKDEEWWCNTIKVHGDITFLKTLKYPTRTLIGFDCSHISDLVPAFTTKDLAGVKKEIFKDIRELDGIFENILSDLFNNFPNCEYRTIEFVRNECKSMIDQIEKLRGSKD